MSIGIIITLIILGIILLLVEFLVVPGVTVAGIAGTLLIVGGVIAAYIYQDPPVSNYITLGTFAIIILLFITAFKTKTWRKLGLKTSINSHSSEDVAEIYKVGDEGVTVSRLAPIGKILIRDKLVEARSLGGYIDPNIPVVIIRTEKNKLYVEQKK